MALIRADDSISKRIAAMCERVNAAQVADEYFYNIPVSELHGGSRVLIGGREMGMFASYSYLGLIGHPRITAAAQAALAKYGTGHTASGFWPGPCRCTSSWSGRSPGSKAPRPPSLSARGT